MMGEEDADVFSHSSDSKKEQNAEINLLADQACTVDGLKSIIELSEKNPSLLSLVQQANVKQRNAPSSFFSFPGVRGSMISLPPFQKWPSQMGWSFSTWISLEPKACAQPYLYNFKTGKSGLGYSAHFTGNCLVLTSIRVKGKGVQHCVAYEFPSKKWIHCAITYHNKWRASEVRIYVNGQLLPTIDIAWQVQTSEIFDKCFIGGSGSIANAERTGELNSFSGQMSAVYLFNEGLSAAQICAIHRLGPCYMGQFRYSNESIVDLPPMISKSLYDGKLASSLFSLYSPVAVDGETLCIQLAPLKSSTTTPAQNYFLSAPHAALLGETKAINSQPICSTIQSIGCSSSLLPLLDHFASTNQSEPCAFLIGFICDLLECSPHWFANEIVQNNGFVMMACSLARDPKSLLSEHIIDIFLNLSRSLITAASPVGGSLLLKHLMDNILFNPSLWIYAETNLQIKLYSYLSNEFLNGTRRTTNNKYTISSSGVTNSTNNPTNVSNTPIPFNNPTSSATLAIQTSMIRDEDSTPMITVTDILFGEIRRVSTVLQSLHALKYFYWIEEERDINVKARNMSQRPGRSDLLIIRSHILRFMKELIIRSNIVPLDEIQAILNYLATCNCPENLSDVLDTLFNLLDEHSEYIVPALEQKNASKVIYGLLSSSSELIRIKSLRLLTLFLARCSHKRKNEIMGPHNLFMLLCDKLKAFLPLTLNTYEALIDLMLEEIEPNKDLRKKRIENSILIKVIATLLREEFNKTTNPGKINQNNNLLVKEELIIRDRFINDLWALIVNSRENRRIILQMSVWQHWLINLIGNTITDSQLVRDQVLAIFRVLLYHATRYEYGGWRVWIDTLAIIHTKISLDEFLVDHNRQDIDPLPKSDSDHNMEFNREPESDSEELESPASLDPNQEKTILHEDDTTKKDNDDNKTRDSESIDEKEFQEETKKEAIESEECKSGDECVTKEEGLNNHEDELSEECLDDSKAQEGISKSTEHGEIKSSEPTSESSKKVVCESADKSVISDPQDMETCDALEIVDEPKVVSSICDSVDLAPSRAFRRMKLAEDSSRGACDPNESSTVSESPTNNEPSSPGQISQLTMTSIPLDDNSSEGETAPQNTANENDSCPRGDTCNLSPKVKKEYIPKNIQQNQDVETIQKRSSGPVHSQNKATASPAFRIPEFKWSPVLIKLLNDLIFSIECDLYNWRCSGNCMNIELGPFVPRSGASGTVGSTAHNSNASNSSSSASRTSTAATSFFDQLLQRSENQVYIINIIHFISQLSDNIIMSAGGLLPLLAEATGGNRSSSGSPSEDASSDRTSPTPDPLKLNEVCEGLMMKQANSLLYRLTNMVDVVIFAASHINLSELEAEKHSPIGSILRQSLRLGCTLTVKNCLVIRSITNKQLRTSNHVGDQLTEVEFPKDFFDSYNGCSILSANNLFSGSHLGSLEGSDLVANVEYSSNQTPNSSSMPSLLPFQCNPIKDGNKLLQPIDVARIQACIYNNTNLDSRESQFLALSSLYFISVLMVSKYRDIIEPKTQQPIHSNRSVHSSAVESGDTPKPTSVDDEAQMVGASTTIGATSGEPGEKELTSGRSSPATSGQSRDSGIQNSGGAPTSASTAPISATTTESITSQSATCTTESNLLNFGRMQPTIGGTVRNDQTLTDILTGRLENTLDVVCPLLKSIMCDFGAFLSRTLVGSHGQDLVNKEADRAFKKANTSPVELVMLLCSQEWQNTLQKNAGLAFIELINEGRMSSIAMKEHIVRVGMEAEFILTRLRADDVTKNEHFQLASNELYESRLNEEMLINNLISSASRRDYAIYRKFRDAHLLARSGSKQNLKLDIWEDDDRRMRRFVTDSYLDQQYYKNPSDDNKLDAKGNSGDKSKQISATADMNLDKKRIMELHESHDMSTLNQIDASSTNNHRSHSPTNHGKYEESMMDLGRAGGHDEFDLDGVDGIDEDEDEDVDRDDDDLGVAEEDNEVLNSDDVDSDNESQLRARMAGLDEVECIPIGSSSRMDHNSESSNSAPNGRFRRGLKSGNFAPTYRRQHGRRRTNKNNQAVNQQQRQQQINWSNSHSSMMSYENQSGCGTNELSGTAIFGADCSLVWSIYSIPGVLSLSHNELYFEPNQNINEILEALKRNPEGDHELIIENLIPAPDPDNLASQYHAHLVYLKSPISTASSTNNGANTATNGPSTSSNLQMNSNNTTNEHVAQKHHNQHHHQQHQLQHQTFIKTYTTLRKSDLKVLRYCDFLTGNAKIALADIRAIFSRHYLLQPQALEIFVAQRSSVMFSFLDSDSMRRMVRYLPPVGVGIKYGIPQSRRASLMSGRQLFEASNMTQKWQRREIGNFQYLMFLNTIAGRSYQDLNQYPVFPWILTNYDDPELDLTLPANFRDLSKPVGALNSKRRQEFIERYQSWDTPKVPAFHYGTHYSTAAFTLNWLCRIRGNAHQAYLAYHDGSYEDESRLFKSIQDSWLSSLTSGQQNVKELIPEFFYLPEMFHSNLGLPPVELPPWANSPEHFVRIHRLALESELVSCQLHQWIDLIFGYKQRGPEAVSAINTFYYLTYQGNVNLNMIQEPAMREAIETQIKHFGQTPSQLTTEPHPPRYSPLHVSPSVFSPSSPDELAKSIKFPFNTAVIHIAACVDMAQARAQGRSTSLSEPAGSSLGTIPNPASTDGINTILTITSNNQFQLHNWTIPRQSSNSEQQQHQQVGSAAGINSASGTTASCPPTPIFTIDPQLEGGSGANKRQLIDVDDLCSSITLRLTSSSTLETQPKQQTYPLIKSQVDWPNAHFVVTLDGRYIIMGSFYDNSFRVFSTSSGKLCQVIYGHRAPITYIARSEGNANGDFTLATCSQDCSLLLWFWNERYSQIEGSGVSAVHNPLPKLSISGHRTPVLSAEISTELGIILSGSKNLILVHTTTNGENLLHIDVSLPRLLDKSSKLIRTKLAEMCPNSPVNSINPTKDAQTDQHETTRPHVADKEKTLLEASMMGDSGRLPPRSQSGSASSLRRASPCAEMLNASLEKFSHLRDLPLSDYYITNIKLARELAYIVVLALPPPRETKKSYMKQQSASDEQEGSISSPSALLMTFNLKGDMMECSTVGQSLNGPRLGDTSLLKTTRDGEHLILNDSPSNLKIVRTFDLQPIYAFNTNDLPLTKTSLTNNNSNNNSNNLESLETTKNRVRSLLVLDHKYLVVGMDNGKLAIYNADFH